MVALATAAVPAAPRELAVSPLRQPVWLPLYLGAAILLAPLLRVGLVLIVATDAHRCEREEARDVA